jgi:hypothetical protein
MATTSIPVRANRRARTGELRWPTLPGRPGMVKAPAGNILGAGSEQVAQRAGRPALGALMVTSW